MRLARQVPAFPKHSPDTKNGASTAPPGYGIDFVDRGLPDDLRTGLESLSGFDLSDVRVHANSGKPAELGAVAYAQGSDIYLGPGGERHLPHEAWHVVQQKQGRVASRLRVGGAAVNDDKALETEADAMGARAESGAAGTAAPRARRTQSPPVMQAKLELLPGETTIYKDTRSDVLRFEWVEEGRYRDMATRRVYSYDSNTHQFKGPEGLYFCPYDKKFYAKHGSLENTYSRDLALYTYEGGPDGHYLPVQQQPQPMEEVVESTIEMEETQKNTKEETPKDDYLDIMMQTMTKARPQPEAQPSSKPTTVGTTPKKIIGKKPSTVLPKDKALKLVPEHFTKKQRLQVLMHQKFQGPPKPKVVAEPGVVGGLTAFKKVALQSPAYLRRALSFLTYATYHEDDPNWGFHVRGLRGRVNDIYDYEHEKGTESYQNHLYNAFETYLVFCDLLQAYTGLKDEHWQKWMALKAECETKRAGLQEYTEVRRTK